MFKQILLPLDLTDKHQAAFDLAVKLTRESGGTIVLLHVIEVIAGLPVDEEKTFYQRLHPPTMGSTLGLALIVAASILCFSVLRSRLSVHELLIGIFVTLTTPVTFMLLARAALYRDRSEKTGEVPPAE